MTEEIIEREYPCAKCGKRAALVAIVPAGAEHSELRPPGHNFLAGRKYVAIDGPLGKQQIGGDELMRGIESALEEGPLALARKGVPSFYCRRCDACYCKDHWITEEIYDEDFKGWYDCTYGICPEGHRVRLDD